VSVPLFATSLEPYMPRIEERLVEAARSGRYILGPEVEEFEREFAAYCGARHCIGVANGTDAITIALRSLGVRPGDEVVVPSFTFYASVEAVASMGATPVFCDVDRETFCVTRATVEAAMTNRTRAVIAVNLFGFLPPLGELRDLGVPVLEDAAQSHGARRDGRRAGTFGDAATFSFFPSKNLGCLGDGGAIVTDSDEVAEMARRLRFHGSRDKSTFTEVGYNSRLDALQAAVLRVLLPELDGWNEARRAAARLYAERGLGELPGVELPRFDGDEHVFHLYVVRSERAGELERALTERGVGARGYYRTPVHEQPAMRSVPSAKRDLPATAELARTHLALPMGTRLDERAIDEVVEAARGLVTAGSRA
jgi:dTDP-3-amino-3,4,6-trideoxy-alpha-D-glucose transaminase